MLHAIIVLTTFYCYLSVNIVGSERDEKMQGTVSGGLETSRETERVINSWDADEWRFSHLVAIMNRYAVQDYFQCGGSLLTTSVVLTACHCLVQTTNIFYPSYILYAIAGVHTLSENQGKQVRDFREENGFVVHRQCNMTKPPIYSDVGLAFLVKPFKLTKTITLVKFISSDEHTLWWWLDRFGKGSKICHVVGWGYTNNTVPDTSQQLRDGRVRLLNQTECEKHACWSFRSCGDTVTRTNNICTVPYEGSMACSGDSGGPLMCNEYIFGIVSVGRKNCKVSSTVPTFYCNPLTILELIKYYIPDYAVSPHPPRQDPPSVVPPYKYPFVVSISNISNKYIPESLCAGSILTVSSVITTCVCLSKFLNDYSDETGRYKNVAVISGITKAFDNSLYEQRLNIRGIGVDCESDVEGPDVGIAFVDGEFPFATRLVQPLYMLSIDAGKVRKVIERFQRTETKCFMATWGYAVEEPTKIRYNVFSEWEVRILHPIACHDGAFCISHRMLCKDITNNSSSLCGVAFNTSQSCLADSGGPLICDGYFFGIVSYNGDLCSPENNVKITTVIGAYNLINKLIPDFSVKGSFHMSSGSRIHLSTFVIYSFVHHSFSLLRT